MTKFLQIKERMKTALQALTKYILGVAFVGLLVFWPAGTFLYPGGWLLMATLFVPMLFLGLVMAIKSPTLLQKRLNHKEEQGEQRKVVAMSGLLFIAVFVIAGLNWRHQWHIMPEWCVWTATGILFLSYLLYAEVMRENAYLSRTIEVQEGQKVIDTGLYGIVRHPMYTATIVLFLSMPLVLGSLIAFAIMTLYIPIIAKRIRNEEAVLKEGLEGYKEYTQRVRYRLIPFIW